MTILPPRTLETPRLPAEHERILARIADIHWPVQAGWAYGQERLPPSSEYNLLRRVWQYALLLSEDPEGFYPQLEADLASSLAAYNNFYAAHAIKYSQKPSLPAATPSPSPPSTFTKSQRTAALLAQLSSPVLNLSQEPPE